MHTLTINGKKAEFDSGVPENLAALLEHLDVNAATVVAEVDGTIIKREFFERTALKAGQTIELVRFVGGG